MAEQEIKKVTTGNYSFDLAVNPSETVLPVIVKLGYKVAIQSALMKWEKQMGYPDTVGADGKTIENKRPKAFKRKDIPFTQEGADLLEKLVGAVQVDISADNAEKSENVDAGIVDVANIALYEGTVYTPKYAEQKALVLGYLFEQDEKTSRKLKSGEDRSITSFCLSRSIEEPSDPWQEDTEFLGAVKSWQVTERERQAAME